MTKRLINWVPKHLCTEMPCHRKRSINLGCCLHLGMLINQDTPNVYNKVRRPNMIRKGKLIMKDMQVFFSTVYV